MPLEPQSRDPSVIERNDLPNNPLRRANPGDTRVGVNADGQFGGELNAVHFHDLTEGEDEIGGNGCGVVPDPRYPDRRFVILGGSGSTDTGTYGSVFVYDTRTGTKHQDIYPDLDTMGDVEAADDSDDIGFLADGVVGDYIIISGGQISDGGTLEDDERDEIRYLDTSQDNPSWQVVDNALTDRVGNRPGGFGYNGYYYHFGGQTVDSDGSNQTIRFDPETETVTVLDDMPVAMSGCGQPFEVDGKIHVYGDTLEDPNPIYVFDPETEAWVDEFEPGANYEYVGGTEAGLIEWSATFKHNGHVFFWEGPNFPGGADIIVWNPETDEWGNIDTPGRANGGAEGAFLGNKRVAYIDGVAWVGGTGGDNGAAIAYVPEDEPLA